MSALELLWEEAGLPAFDLPAELEQLYVDLASGQEGELRALRQSGADGPVLETVSRAASARSWLLRTEIRATSAAAKKPFRSRTPIRMMNR